MRVREVGDDAQEGGRGGQKKVFWFYFVILIPTWHLVEFALFSILPIFISENKQRKRKKEGMEGEGH